MSKFRVGDLITGKLKSPYSITTKESICEILFISGNFDGDIRVRLVSHKNYREMLEKSTSCALVISTSTRKQTILGGTNAQI